MILLFAMAAIGGYLAWGAADALFDQVWDRLLSVLVIGLAGLLILYWIFARAMVDSGALQKNGAVYRGAEAVEGLGVGLFGFLGAIVGAIVGPVLKLLGL